MQQQTVIKTLSELFGLTDDKVKDVGFPVNDVPGPMTPKADAAYQFQADHVRRLLLWIGGIAGRNLLITGPTGCGKSSLIEQFCARLGRELYRVPCHGKLEFSELTGQLTVLPDGSTSFVHGPLPRAMRSGAVLLLDEMNFIHPSAIGALNTVLDGGPLLIPETGESIQPHDDFRIVATGNAIEHGDDSSLYRGTQRMNLALMQRFLTLKADYLAPIDEAAMLHRAVPGLPGKVIGILAEVAHDVREAFKRGDIESTVSTRTLVKWAKVLQARMSVLVQKPEEEMAFGLRFVLTDGLRAEDAKAIEGTLERRAAGLKLDPATAAPAPAASAQPAKARKKSGTAGLRTKVHVVVNPNRENTGTVAFWAGIEPAGNHRGFSLNGTIAPSHVVRVTNNRDLNWIAQTLTEKRNSRGYRHGFSLEVDYFEADSIVRDAVSVLAAAIGDGLSQVRCGYEEGRNIAEAIARQMGRQLTFV